MLRIVLYVAAALLGSAALAGPDGRIRVVDGDTFDIGGTVVRLHAIDAPELDQSCDDADNPAWNCGIWVRDRARAMFEGREASCSAVDTDRYGRVVAKCRVEGRDMGATLVSDGLAFAYREYGLDYDLTEKTAAINQRGLHATSVMPPAAFRSAQRVPGESTGTVTARDDRAGKRKLLPNALNPDCPIKGNVSRSGERIYHLPGQSYYDATRISLTRGERWFCTEAEARAAGWRKARK